LALLLDREAANRNTKRFQTRLRSARLRHSQAAIDACKLGLEGIVSKRRDFPYRSGRTKSWIKVNNPNSPAMLRIEDGPW
jgi:ATP-dependent DNA ligase